MNTLTTIETMETVDDGAMSDTSSDLDSRASSPDPDYNEGNLLTEAMENEVTAQLVAAGKIVMNFKFLANSLLRFFLPIVQALLESQLQLLFNHPKNENVRTHSKRIPQSEKGNKIDFYGN